MIREKINNISVNDLVKLVDEYNRPVNGIRIHSRKLINELTIKTKNYGNLIITNYYENKKDGRKHFTGKFLKTGYIVNNIHRSAIKTGNIKDPLFPKYLGVGYIGEYNPTMHLDKELHKSMYVRWRNMLSRCYDPKNIGYDKYGALGVKVSNDWHSYSTFLHDSINLPGFNRELILSGKLTLDKDILQKNTQKNKMIYSKNTCCWISMAEQNCAVDHDKAQDSLKRSFVAIFPDGSKYIGKGISKFARKYHLDSGDCSRALNGKINHVKGIRIYPIENEE